MYLKFKILLLSIVPVALALAAAVYLVSHQADELVTQEVTALEQQILDEKSQELQNYTELALTSIRPFLPSLDATDSERETSARQIVEILESLTYASDGYFFVYERDGTNVLHPQQPWRVGQNWWDVQDTNGVFLIRELIGAAEQGGGFVPYLWERPSTKEIARKLSYAVLIDELDWVIGTGVYLDEIDGLVETIHTDVEARVDGIFVSTSVLFAFCVIFVGGVISLLAYRETSFADEKLRELYNQVIDVQEEERARVSRDLHDGISQLLVSANYAFDLARTRLRKKYNEDVDSLDEGFARIDEALQEVRRISSDLRPKDLDDLGLSSALLSLGERFEKETGICTFVSVAPTKDDLSKEQQSALYRIAQEALTNIERHAEAEQVEISIEPGKRELALCIKDDGVGFRGRKKTSHETYGGIGIRNMEERMAVFSGHLSIQANTDAASGTLLIATMPLSKHASGTGHRRPA